MANYVKEKPEAPSFSQKGLNGYKFKLDNKNLEVYYVAVTKGHDNYIISKKVTHMYYVMEGKGFFDIDGTKHEVKPGMLIEVPPNVEYAYSGKMVLLLIISPPWFKGNDTIVRKNPSVD